MQRSQRRQQCALSYRRVQTAPTSTYGLRVVGFRTTFRVVGGAVELRSWVTKFGYEVWLRSLVTKFGYEVWLRSLVTK